MSRYIDGDKLIELFKERHGNRSEYLKIYALSEIINVIDKQPTADAQEVKHGKWVSNEKLYRTLVCSNCSRGFCYECTPYEYCYMCGSKNEFGG